MNFHNLNKKLVWLFSLVVLAVAIQGCGSKSSTSSKGASGGKTLSSSKSAKPSITSGLKGLFFKPTTDDPTIFNGEIVAVSRKGWSQPTPFGMVLVPSGSYLMGQGDEDPSRTSVNLPRRVTVSAFFMDDTEITNYEYRQFVEALLKDSLSVLGQTKIMSDYYPDTTRWAEDFRVPGKDFEKQNFTYADPMVEHYFSSPAFDMYPVVGINWAAAKYFCEWRSNLLNSYRKTQGLANLPKFALPTESEWEWAARGGRASAKYPWGNPYLANAKGCLLANFKPHRGNYDADGYEYTAPANAYSPNDYGLYNMAGNVAEWCLDAFEENSAAVNWDLNSYNSGSKLNENGLKVVRGGSWKDIGYYLETGTRSSEYEKNKRAYVGFRCVMRYLGRPASR
jgi:gliding motility-associated lipoprotein GldK